MRGFDSEPAFEAVLGEGLSMYERLVVSPCEGALRVREATPGSYLMKGEIVARVVGPDGQSVAVHTPFSGLMMGYLLPSGSPVRPKEPVAWLRTE